MIAGWFCVGSRRMSRGEERFRGLREAENRPRKTAALFASFSGWLRTMTRLALDITGLGSRGQGLARRDGQTITVPFALPGERIVAEVEQRSRRRSSRSWSPRPSAGPDVPAFRRLRRLQRPAPRAPTPTARGSSRARHPRSNVGASPVMRLALLDAHGAGRRRVCFHARHRDGHRGDRIHGGAQPSPRRHRRLSGAGAAARRSAGHRPPSRIAVHRRRSGLRPPADRYRRPVSTATLRGLRRGDRLADERAGAAARSARGRSPVDQRRAARSKQRNRWSVRQGDGAVAAGRIPPGDRPRPSDLLADAGARARLAEARRVADLFCGVGPFAFGSPSAARDGDRLRCSRPRGARLSPPATPVGLKPVRHPTTRSVPRAARRPRAANFRCGGLRSAPSRSRRPGPASWRSRRSRP